MDYIIYDLETTCWDGYKTEEMEITEIGAVFLNGNDKLPRRDFQIFVKPQNKIELTKFCKDLTSIKQNAIYKAPEFPEAFEEFLDWIGPEPIKLCSWVEFDIDIIKQECERGGISMPTNYAGHIDIKKVLADVYSTKKSVGFKSALKKVTNEFHRKTSSGN